MKRTAFLPLLGLAYALGCDGSHSDLGLDDTGSSQSASSSSGAGGMVAAGGGGAAPVEPDGPPKLTLANALVDRPAVLYCLLESPANPNDAAKLQPETALPYAHAAAIDVAPLPSNSDLELVLITGDLSGLAGANCRALVDDPQSAPLAEIFSLGAFPAGSLHQPRSLLVAATGCLGGVGHEAAQAESICGVGYTPDSPTLNVVVAPLSRLRDPQAVGQQVLNAVSGTVTPLNVGIVPGLSGAQERAIASNVVFGASAPFPPYVQLSAAEFGGVSAATLRTYLAPGGDVAQETNVGEAMARGGLSAGDFANGTNVVFLAVGPTPSLAPGPWWNGFLLTAIKADP